MSFASDTIAKHPHPGNDPAARLRHTLNIYANRPDDEWVSRATIGIYSDDETTGITWGDLRALADRLGI